MEVAFKYFDKIQENQNSIATKVQVIEENLSKSLSDLSLRLEQLDNPLKDQSSSIQPTTSLGKGTPTSTDYPQNVTTNQPSSKPAVA